MRNRLLLLTIFVITTFGTAQANTVTFDSLVGMNGDPFTSTTEQGVTVTSTTGLWQEAHVVGNPVPAIVTFSFTATVTITAGSLFNFLSFDLGTEDTSATHLPSYAFTGFLNNVLVLNQTGTPVKPVGNPFLTISNLNPSQLMDRLTIFTILNGTSASLDNINVNPTQRVPEPGTISLLAAALAAFVLGRKHFARAS